MGKIQKQYNKSMSNTKHAWFLLSAMFHRMMYSTQKAERKGSAYNIFSERIEWRKSFQINRMTKSNSGI